MRVFLFQMVARGRIAHLSAGGTALLVLEMPFKAFLVPNTRDHSDSILPIKIVITKNSPQ